MTTKLAAIDPKRDLVLEREVDLSPRLIWSAWTQARHLNQWFAPKPWTCRSTIDLEPGGAFNVTLISPEGAEIDIPGCVLEVTEQRRFIWTCGLTVGYRPAPVSTDRGGPLFTAIIEVTPTEAGTKYRVLARHSDEESCKKHREMGFHGGWGTALDQLIEHMKR